MPWLTPQDRTAYAALDRWIDTASQEIDDIASWRDYSAGRHWPQPPRRFFHDTAALVGWILEHHPKLDPSPLQAIHKAVSAWYEDWNADRLPPQNVLSTRLQEALLILLALRVPIDARIHEERPREETGENGSKARRKKSRGTPQVHNLDADKRLMRDWQAAKGQGTSRHDFCRRRGIQLDDFIKAQDRVKYHRGIGAE